MIILRVMKKECFKEVLSLVKNRPLAGDLAAVARMNSTKSAVVFQGRKRYAEAEEEE